MPKGVFLHVERVGNLKPQLAQAAEFPWLLIYRLAGLVPWRLLLEVRPVPPEPVYSGQTAALHPAYQSSSMFLRLPSTHDHDWTGGLWQQPPPAWLRHHRSRLRLWRVPYSFASDPGGFPARRRTMSTVSCAAWISPLC